MKLQHTEELEVIREKVTRREVDYNQLEKQCLSAVYEEIHFNIHGKKTTLDISCSACINSAMNIVHNYVMYHEEREYPKPEQQANVTIVTDSKDAYKNMKLKELRKMFPDIKATSVEKFIEQL